MNTKQKTIMWFMWAACVALGFCVGSQSQFKSPPNMVHAAHAPSVKQSSTKCTECPCNIFEEVCPCLTGWKKPPATDSRHGDDETNVETDRHELKHVATMAERPNADDGETTWSKYLALQMGGVAEYKTPDMSRIDIITDTYAYEVEWAEKWKEAPTQAVFYAVSTGRKPGIVLLMNGSDSSKLGYLRCKIVCERLGVKLTTVHVVRELNPPVEPHVTAI